MDEVDVLVLSDDNSSRDIIEEIPEIDFVSAAFSVNYVPAKPASVISIDSNSSNQRSSTKSPQLSMDSNDCNILHNKHEPISQQNIQRNLHQVSSDSDDEPLPKIVISKPLSAASKIMSQIPFDSLSSEKPVSLKRVPSYNSTGSVGRQKTKSKDVSPAKLKKPEYVHLIRNNEFSKCIKIVVAPKLVQNEWWNPIETTLKEDGFTLVVNSKVVLPIINWQRLTMSQPSTFASTENYMIVWNSKEVADHILTKTLFENMRNVIETLKNIAKSEMKLQLTLVIYGMKDYLRKIKHRRKRPSASVENNTSAKSLDENDLEVAITGLMLRLGVCTLKVETSDEFSQLLSHCNKAIAEGPYKKLKYQYEDHAGVLRGENKTSIKVDSAGNGLLRVWQQALTKMPGLGQHVARELARKYPSPRALKAASVSEIADLVVQGRRVGVEQARRLNTYLNEMDGNVLLI